MDLHLPLDDGGFEYEPLGRFGERDRELYIKAFEEAILYDPRGEPPCPPGLTEAECDTIEALARWNLGYDGGRRYYTYVDRDAKNGLPYFYAVVAYDHLISSGVPILDGLEITARTAGNAIVEDAIMAVRKGVEGGLTIAQPLKDTGVFPPMVVQMIGVGEQTGALDAMLSKIADFYEEEVDQAVANLLTLMEPVMILFLGISVGGIIIAMYLPLFDLISKLS